MLGFAWLTIRQAQDALKNGRLDEAHRLLNQPGAVGHKGSWELLTKVARGFVERGLNHLKHDNLAAAWNDLVLAEQIGAPDCGSAQLRQDLIRRGLDDAQALLDAGEPARALEMLSKLRERTVQHSEIQLLEEAARGWNQARELADRGEFAQALQSATRVRRLMTNVPTALGRFQEDLERRSDQFAAILIELHDAMDRAEWRKVLQLADLVLAMAPNHAEARKARARAWKSVEPSTTPTSPPPMPEKIAAKARSPRYLLWIDGVGGFLICLGSKVTIGQAIPESDVDIPLFADVSRTHAVLTRDSEGYLLEAVRAAQVNGQKVDNALLHPGDRVTLGTSCQIQFFQPVPVSVTARLDVVSGHRLPLSVDRVFLMADTLVIGPGPQAHVVIPEMEKSIVLFRNKDGLGIRYSGEMNLNGETIRERGNLTENSRVIAENITFALESVGAQLGR